jgi:hypothetical protein
MGCGRAAVDAFSIFFPDMDRTCPDVKAIAVLSLALKRLNNSILGAQYAHRLFIHLEELEDQLRPPVYSQLARFSLEGGQLDEAAGYLLKIPIQDRREASFCEVSKRCVLEGRADLMTALTGIIYLYKLYMHLHMIYL